MTAGVLLSLLLGAGVLFLVLRPLLAPDATAPEERGAGDLDHLRELHARQQMLLASLKDLEDDRSTDKIGDDDYEQLKARLSSRAIEVMQELDEAERHRQETLAQQERKARPLKYPGKRKPSGAS